MTNNSILPRVHKFLTDRNWHDLKPGDIAKSVAIESAELLELFQWINPNSSEVKQNQELMKSLRSEASDILIYLMELSVILDFNIFEACDEKLDLIEKKYPAEVMKQDRDHSTPANQEYMRIKKAFRAG